MKSDYMSKTPVFSPDGMPTFFEKLFLELATESGTTSQNFHLIMSNYGSVFGEEHLHVIDSYGAMAAGKDIFEVLCNCATRVAP
jgi:hypothetical protein